MFSAAKIAAPSAGGYTLSKSLRFRASASAQLSKVYSAAATNLKIQTYSVWAKLGAATAAFGSTIFGAYNGINAGAQIFSVNFNGNLTLDVDDGLAYVLTTTQKFSDPSAWYHIVVSIDTTQTTASNRVKLYINGSQVTAFSTATYPALNYNMQFMQNAGNSYIGRYGGSANYQYDGYLAEMNVIDGQALTPTSFGSFSATTGVWQPAKYSGTYGTNGFYLPFSNTASTTTLGYDFSGNSNNWTTNNISITAGVTYDSMTDVPTLTSATAANYAVLNPLNSYTGTCINGNMTFSNTASSGWQNGFGTFQVQSGKWYFEGTVVGATSYHTIGVCTPAATFNNGFTWGGAPTGDIWAYFDYNGNKFGPGSYTGSGSAYGATYNSGDVIGVAVDLDNGTLTFYKNNSSQGVAFNTGLVGTAVTVICASNGNGTTGKGWNLNFGQQPFTYTPPTGFVALNAYNLPTGTILQGNKYMDATLYTGDGTTNHVITNAAPFQPDLVWYKGRSVNYDNSLFDSVRGAGLLLVSNSTQAESSITGVKAFNSNGFTLDNAAAGNNNGTTYVAWQWQAGKGSTSSNTNGSITSTVSVNASAGFSVVTYTGSTSGTVGHGLGVVPNLIFVKRRDSTSAWVVYSSVIGKDALLYLNTADAASSSTSYWGSGGVTSTVFGTSPNSGFVNNTGNLVAYCWAAIAGFSAFGSYTGNGSTSGPFVYTGFQPRYILIKRTDSAGDWYVWDTARNTYNTGASYLLTDSSNAEATSSTVNTLANGFNIVNASTVNASGGTYIYAAFASNSFKNSLAF